MIKVFSINFLLAISTAMGMTLLPIIATESLGISLMLLGFIEGFTELLSNILKLVSGNLFDRMKNKKMLFVVPTCISFLSKAALVIFLSKYTVLFSKLTERISNGIFGSPRDAYVAKNAFNKGLALSLLNCSKTLGCVIGTFIISLSTLFIGSINSNIRTLAILAMVITFCAFVTSFFIQSDLEVKEEKFSLKGFNRTFKKLIPVYFFSLVFFLGRFNDGILMLFLKNQGMPEWFYLSTISFFNIVMFVFAPVCGIMLDRERVKTVLFLTIGALLSFNIFFYNLAVSPWLFASLGLISWGMQRSGAAIIFSFMVAQKTEKKFIGTALGILALVNACGSLISSIVSGYLTSYSYNAVFAFAGLMSLLALSVGVYNYYSLKDVKAIILSRFIKLKKYIGV